MLLVFAGVIGACIGSFANVLMDRLPKGEDVVSKRSHCDFCKKTLSWYELIPVVSFLIQRARCRNCHRPLSWQYPGIELLTALGFMYCSSLPVPLVSLVGVLVLFTSGIVIVGADIKYRIIPDSMVVMSLIGAVLYLWPSWSVPVITAHVMASTFVGLGFYLLWKGTHGKGMGLGDVKLSCVIGFLLGFPESLFALYGAFLTGATVGVILMITRKKTLKSKIAFGPFLILGVLLTALFHTHLITLWNTLW